MRRSLRAAASTLLAGVAALAVAGPLGGISAPVGFLAQAAAGPASALETELTRIDPADAVAGFYRDRRYQPLWIEGRRLRPEARSVLSAVSLADRHGLDPQAYRPDLLRAAIAVAASRQARDLARAELALSRAYADYIVDLREAPEAARPVFIDAKLDGPRLTRRAALDDLARAPSLDAGLQAAQGMNPIYEQLREGLAQYRAAGGGPQEAVILANLARARALPQHLGRRFVLVDIAAARLWAYEDGQVRDSMDVVVGKPSQQTPVMIGLMRYAVFNPYWNIPDDLARNTYAPRVLRRGVSYLEDERMEALSGWAEDAQRLDPQDIDWAEVAAGRRPLRVRQQPGPNNTMGAVKLMLPNQLGIYLHDTPMKYLFAQSRRTASAGCVRLADAMRLTRWLFGGDVPPLADTPELRMDLPEPVPVYITYFTAAPGAGGMEFRADIYERDAKLLAQLDRSAPGAVRLVRSEAAGQGVAFGPPRT